MSLQWRHNGCDGVSNHQVKKTHQSSASLAFVRGIHRWPVNSPHKWPVTRKMFPFDDVIMHRKVLCLIRHQMLTTRSREISRALETSSAFSGRSRQHCCRVADQISEPHDILSTQIFLLRDIMRSYDESPYLLVYRDSDSYLTLYWPCNISRLVSHLGLYVTEDNDLFYYIINTPPDCLDDALVWYGILISSRLQIYIGTSFYK